MSTPKKTVRARGPKSALAPKQLPAAPELPNLYRVVLLVTAAAEELGIACASIARVWKGHEVILLKQGVGKLDKVLIELDAIEEQFRAYRRSIGRYKEVGP